MPRPSSPPSTPISSTACVEGVRFGLLLGVFVATVFAGVNYATLNIGLRHSLTMAVAAVVEWTLLGSVIGVVYKPAAAPGRQGAGV